MNVLLYEILEKYSKRYFMDDSSPHLIQTMNVEKNVIVKVTRCPNFQLVWVQHQTKLSYLQ